MSTSRDENTPKTPPSGGDDRAEDHTGPRGAESGADNHPERGANLAFLVWLAGFILLIAILLYDLLKGLLRRWAG
jgi:hypothetical protein